MISPTRQLQFQKALDIQQTQWISPLWHFLMLLLQQFKCLFEIIVGEIIVNPHMHHLSAPARRVLRPAGTLVCFLPAVPGDMPICNSEMYVSLEGQVPMKPVPNLGGMRKRSGSC